MQYDQNSANTQKMLSAYLAGNIEGTLNPHDTVVFLRIFESAYIPDNNETRYPVAEIDAVRIERTQYGNKCFAVKRNGLWIPTSIKRMTGSKPTVNQILHRAMRFAIEPQIAEFKATNRLDMLSPCPVSGDYLGPDAQVDHQIPFHVLADHYIGKNSGISCFYSTVEKNYVVEQPDRAKWQRFHRKFAKLRWLSKESNKTAHLDYQKLKHALV